MKTKALRALRFLRVTDEQDNLSLTNIALAAVLARLLMLPTVDVESLVGFVAALVGYQVKRFAAGLTGTTEATSEAEDLKKMLGALQTKVTALELGQRINR